MAADRVPQARLTIIPDGTGYFDVEGWPADGTRDGYRMEPMEVIPLPPDDNKNLNVYKVGSFYPYLIVAARSEEEAIEVVKREVREIGDPNLVNAHGMGHPAFAGQPAWVVEQLDISEPGIIEGNYG